MGSGFKLSSRICTNSFAGKNKEMSLPFLPNNYFGFQNKNQYSYNIYHQLADNSAGFGARGARWARTNNIHVQFIPRQYN